MEIVCGYRMGKDVQFHQGNSNSLELLVLWLATLLARLDELILNPPILRLPLGLWRT